MAKIAVFETQSQPLSTSYRSERLQMSCSKHCKMIVLLFLHIYFIMETISTGTDVLQDSGFKAADVGDNVTLRCSCQDEKLAVFTWYQQRLGGTPELISQWAKGSPSPTVMQRFRQRFRIVQSPDEHQTNLLTITGLQATDSATYFCAVQVFGSVQFGDGVFVRVRASASYAQSVVQAEARAELGRGEPLELSCAVEAEACSGEKGVYWLKHGASQVTVHPGEDCPASARDCTLRLGIRSVEPTDAGVYYCVLSSCGEILFGNGTEVQITDPKTAVVEYVLSGALAFTATLAALLSLAVLRKMPKNMRHDRGTTPRSSSGMGPAPGHIYYAALRPKKASRSQVQRDATWSECVYYKVRQ